MISFNRKQKFLTTEHISTVGDNLRAGERHTKTGRNFGNRVDGQIPQRAVPESYARVPIKCSPRVHEGSGELKSYTPRSNALDSNCHRHRASKFFRKLLRSTHRKSIATMADITPETTFIYPEIDFGNVFFDKMLSQMGPEEPNNFIYELPQPLMIHELPLPETCCELPQPEACYELPQPERCYELSQPDGCYELPPTPLIPEYAHFPVQQPYRHQSQEDAAPIPPPSHDATSDHHLDASNDFGMGAVRISHNASVPLAQDTQFSSRMVLPSAPPHTTLRRGVSLSVDVRPINHYPPSLFPQHTQFSPDLSQATSGSDQSAQSSLFSQSWPQASMTPATPAPSSGSDSAYQCAASPSRNVLFGQGFSPETPMHIGSEWQPMTRIPQAVLPHVRPGHVRALNHKFLETSRRAAVEFMHLVKQLRPVRCAEEPLLVPCMILTAT